MNLLRNSRVHVSQSPKESPSTSTYYEESPSVSLSTLTKTQSYCLRRLGVVGKACPVVQELSEEETKECDHHLGSIFNSDHLEDVNDNINTLVDAATYCVDPGHLQDLFTGADLSGVLKVKPKLADPKCKRI